MGGTIGLKKSMYTYLVYVSSAAELFSDAELVDLLAKSRANNERQGITGMLVYKDGNFMQVIEGPKKEVEDLHSILEKDPRHKNIIQLVKGENRVREFSSWSMGFCNLSGQPVPELPGFSDFMNEPLNSRTFKEQPHKAWKLLLRFRENMR